MNHTLRIPASLALIILLALGLSSCGQKSADNVPATPPNEVDRAINDYEKDANELVRVVRKLKGGDLRVTIQVINQRQQIKESGAKVQQLSSRMTPAQAQRFAALSAKAAPYLEP